MSRFEMQRFWKTSLFVIPHLAASPVFAEVCDKVRPHWTPESGHVSQFDELFYFVTSPAGIGVIAVIVGTIYVKKTWAFVVIALLLCLLAGLLFTNWNWPLDGVAAAAVTEGCAAAPILVCLTLLAISALLLFQARRNSP